jgi:hypothetical protein
MCSSKSLDNLIYEIKSIEEDHEKIAQVVENTEQSHAANVEPKHEKAHSNESLKDTFFPECLVNESRCDICGKTFQTDNIDLGEDDGSEYLSDSEQHDTLSISRSTLAPVRNLFILKSSLTYIFLTFEESN